MRQQQQPQQRCMREWAFAVTEQTIMSSANAQLDQGGPARGGSMQGSGHEPQVPEIQLQAPLDAARTSVLRNLSGATLGHACMHARVVQRVAMEARAGTDSRAAAADSARGMGLLGSSGEAMAAAQVAFAALRGVHETEDRMLRDYTPLVLMTTWALTEVRAPIAPQSWICVAMIPALCGQPTSAAAPTSASAV